MVLALLAIWLAFAFRCQNAQASTRHTELKKKVHGTLFYTSWLCSAADVHVEKKNSLSPQSKYFFSHVNSKNQLKNFTIPFSFSFPSVRQTDPNMLQLILSMEIFSINFELVFMLSNI